MSKKSSFPVPVGASSLLVIFAVLCLTVFALLTLSTMEADVKMADENMKVVTQYYEADYKAEEIIAKIRRGEDVKGVIKQENVYAFSCDISETQVLSVVVKKEKNRIRILQWQEIAIEEWNPQEYIKVWGAE